MMLLLLRNHSDAFRHRKYLIPLVPPCDYSWHGTTPGPQRSWAESRRLLLARDYSWPVTPAPLVGKRLLAGGLRVYFCLDSCLVYINFAHTQDHDYVLYLCGGTSGVVWTACFSLLSSKKMENEENSG